VTSRRRPWLAAALSFVVVGLGDAYNGRVARGIRLALLFAVLGAADALLARTSSGGALFALATVLLAFRTYAGARAYRDARRLGDAAEPRRSWLGVAGFVAILLVVLVPLQLTLRPYRAWRVPSASMTPTVVLGDRLISDQWAYAAALANPLTGVPIYRFGARRTPARGDVIVFTYPRDRSKQFIKRVIATPGETVEVRDATVRIDGAVVDEPYARYDGPKGADFGPYQVPADHVFVLGDNRNQSYDSRFWGPVPLDDVIGRVERIYWSTDWSRVGMRVR
jgi:signal peptidase I